VACLSNLRQVHQLLMFYASVNNDQVPLGYRLDPVPSKQFNSMVFSATTGQFTLFGWVYQAKLIPQPRIFYCPSENDPKEQFDTSLNPWPKAGVNPAANVYVGYGGRPDFGLPDTPDPGTVLPKLSQFQNKAILSDLVSTSVRVDTRHRSCVNVLYGNGGAHMVNRPLIQVDLSASGNPFPPTASYNAFQDDLWSILDHS
jgi:hypothetical protein